MKKMFIPFLFMLPFTVKAQNDETFNTHVQAGLGAGNVTSIDLGIDAITLNKSIKKGYIIIDLNLGGNYAIDPNIPFSANLEYELKTYLGGVQNSVLSVTNGSLALNENSTRAYQSINLIDYVNQPGGNDDLSFDQLELEITSSTLPVAPYSSHIQLTLSTEIVVGLEVINEGTTISAVQPNDDILVSNKIVDFIWTDDLPVSNYEIQLLRLYNLDELKTSPDQISATLDWTKASSFVGPAAYDMANNQKSRALSVVEGTGYYTFRIRPVSDYRNEGDSRNFGQWTTHDPSGTTVSLDQSSVVLPYFYFADPDDNKNWIYSRVFTEGGKTKETLSFANGLSQATQNQIYLPSQGVTIITQTVQDKTGRPALVSIPVPLNGRVGTYQEKFIMDAAGNLYDADDFDANDNYLNPSTLTSTGYYTNNTNPNIPNDEGYGFTRTVFYNDPLGRTSLQSGVGAMHKIGGKNTKYLYSTPSEDELVALFGDEAPDHESVVKTVTVDPNNVASVTYTSKEGNVIATSLAFYQESPNLLELDETPVAMDVTDRIRQNTKTPGGFVSSKRITLLQDNSVQLSYSIECVQFNALCQSAELDCGYVVDIEIIRLDEQGEILSTQTVLSQSLNAISCQTVGDKDYKLVTGPTVSLDAGTYVVEKTLRVGDVDLQIRDNAQTIRKQVDPITNLVAGWLESIENTAMLAEFNKSIYELSNAISTQTLDAFDNSPRSSLFPVDIPAEFFTEVYGDYKDQYQLLFEPAGYDPFQANAGNPISFTLGTPCCIINIPVTWIPPFDCDDKGLADVNGDGFLNVVNYLDVFEAVTPVTQEYLPDFEGYMLAFMSDCIGPDFADEAALKTAIYDNFMDGWKIEGTFNMMVYHMLTDQYSVENTVEGTPEVKVQYECDQLLGCWEAQLARLKDDLCVQFNFYQDGGRKKVSDEYTSEYEDDPDEDKYNKNHNQHFDDNFKGGFFLTRWIARRKVSKRMRKLQSDDGGEGQIQPEYGKFHLVKEFLECTGYKFERIITPFNPQPHPNDILAGHDYSPDREAAKKGPPKTLNRLTSSAVYFDNASIELKSTTPLAYKYIPLNDWKPIRKVRNTDGSFVEDPKGTPLFPFIKNPIYAFKYFEYDEFNDDAGNPLYQDLETDLCFSDPNDCFQLDTSGKIVVDGSNQPIKIPCCSASPAWNEPGCFADPDYPGLNTSMVGYGTDAQGNPAKYVVSDFCEVGRIRCLYTHEVWSAGQRLTFYNQLSKYVIPDEDQDWGGLAEFEVNCTDLNTDNEWFVFSGTLEEQEINGYPDLATRTIINDNGYPIASYSQLQLSSGQTMFKYVELEIEGKINECNSRCETRRSEFKRELLAMLTGKCYIIGGCFVSDVETPEVIPAEDVDLIVDAMVNMCQTQCNLTTFSCQSRQCREFSKPNFEIGFDVSKFDLKYGMGGYNPQFCDGTTYAYLDASKCQDNDGDGIYECELFDPVTGNLNLLSWYEYTKLDQVSAWEFDIEMPIMCKDADGNPLTDSEALACCAPGAPNTTAGDTFVPRTDYELSTNQPADGLNPQVGDAVKSKAVGINVRIEN